MNRYCSQDFRLHHPSLFRGRHFILSPISLTQVAAALVILMVGVSCTKEKREAIVGSGSSGPTGPATLSSLQSDVFRLGCAVSGCHDSRSKPAGNLSLVDVSVTYNQIVGRNSTQALGTVLVIPGNPDESYFLAKIKGTHLNMGGSGDVMPQYAAALNQAEIDRIAEWIADGAIKN